MASVPRVGGVVSQSLVAAVLLTAPVAPSWAGIGHAAGIAVAGPQLSSLAGLPISCGPPRNHGAVPTPRQLFSFSATFVAGPDQGRTLAGTVFCGGPRGQVATIKDDTTIVDGAAKGQASDLLIRVGSSQHPVVPAGTTAPVALAVRTAGGHAMEILSWSFGASTPMSLTAGSVSGGTGAPPTQGAAPGGTLAAALSGPRAGDQASMTICIGFLVNGRCIGVLVDPLPGM